MNRYLLTILMIFTLVGFTSCSPGEGFSALEEVVDGMNGTVADEEVEIQSYTPLTTPVILTSTNERTFAVTVNSTAGSVNYKFKLDGATIQDTSSPFYIMNGSTLTAGTHTLIVEATNSINTATHTFNLRKNTAPSISVNSPISSTISCIGGSSSLSVSGFDFDNDSMSFSFLLNGAVNSTYYSTTNNASSATLQFTPTCALVGSNTVTIRVTDQNGESNDYSASVNVSNPTVASITSYSPIANPVVITSTGSQQFIISPDGSPPYDIVWTITPGGVISACNNNTSCTLNASGSYIGSHTLTAELTDNNNTTDTQTFNVIFNAKHTFTVANSIQTTGGVAGLSSTSTDLKFNCNDSVAFNVTSNDQNFGDAGQTHNITWTYGGVNVTDASISSMFNVVKNIGTNPVTSTLTYTPNCSSAALQGDKEIVVTVTDGLENRTNTWNTRTNYLSNACLALAAGEICTIAGRPGQGSGVHVVDESNKVRIQPSKIIQGPDADTYFISDRNNGVVWFYNDKSSGTYNFKSCESNSCSNTTGPFKIISVGPKTLTALVGTGVVGLGSAGEISTDFYLNQPRGMAWDNTNKVLYVADFGNNRIVSVNFNTASDANTLGRPQVFGGQCTPIASCTNTTAVTAASLHKCTGVNELVLNGNKLYAACFSNPAGEYSLKVFDTVANTAQNLLRVVTATNPPVEGALDGTATSHPIYALVKHPTEDALIASLQAGFGNLLLINISGSPSFFGGTIAPATNSMVRLTRSTTAMNAANNKAWDDVTHTVRAHAIYPRVRSNTLEGFYLADMTANTVAFFNTSASSITLGNVPVASGFIRRIWGAAAGLLRPANNGDGQNIFNAPLGLIESSNKLIVADESNWNLTTANTYTTNGATSNLFNSKAQNFRGGFDGDGNVAPTATRLNEPTSLFYSEGDNKLYITDVLNYRIRSIDLNIGMLKTEISNGSSVASNETAGDNLLPNANALRTTRDLYKLENKNALLYVGSSNSSQHIRAYNQNTTGISDDIFMTTIDIGKISTIAGRNNIAGAAWNNGTMGGQLATASAIRMNAPWGIVADGVEQNIYIANSNDHCILNVDSDGNIWQHIGVCGSAYTNIGPITDGDFTTARFFNPKDMELDPINKDDGNFFVVDGSLNTAHMSSIRYANLSTGSVYIRNPSNVNVHIPAGQIKTIVSGLGLMITGVAAFEDWICYSQGYGATVYSTTSQKVVCFDRSTFNVKTFGLDDTIKGKIPLNTEQEGIDAEVATFTQPSGLTFDSEGNLYVAERGNSVIRMIKRWWP